MHTITAHNRPAWPAPPKAVTPWESMRLTLTPRVQSAPRRTPIAAAERPERRVKSRRGRKLDEILGLVHRFGVWHKPTINDEDLMGALGHVASVSVMLTETCLDRSLARIDSGKASFDLCIQHEQDVPLASSANAPMEVFRLGSQLFFRLVAAGDDAKIAAHVIRGQHRRAMSFGLSRPRGTLWSKDGHGYLIIEQARLAEVSVVEEAGCPGCMLLI